MVFESEDFLHCPHCDGVTFSADPSDVVTITEDGVRVDPFDCLTCGEVGLYPTDLTPGYIVPGEARE